MGQILLSLPCALFWYRTIFGIEFITQMHVLSIYLVLGIGADDLFVVSQAFPLFRHALPVRYPLYTCGVSYTERCAYSFTMPGYNPSTCAKEAQSRQCKG
jgi:hypothetical protein